MGRKRTIEEATNPLKEGADTAEEAFYMLEKSAGTRERLDDMDERLYDMDEGLTDLPEEVEDALEHPVWEVWNAAVVLDELADTPEEHRATAAFVASRRGG